MRRIASFLLLLSLLLTLTGCGQSAATGNTQDPVQEPSEETLPTPEPYTILDPTVQPEGGERDGVAYAAYNGVVEHLFFHPVVAYPELAFDGDNQANGIDDYMVTADEYKKSSRASMTRAIFWWTSTVCGARSPARTARPTW